MHADKRRSLAFKSTCLVIGVAVLATVIWMRLPDNSSILLAGSRAYAASFGNEPVSPADYAKLAESDPLGLLEVAIKHYHANVHDYTGIFIKTEQLASGPTPEQHIEILFKEAPFSVVMNYVKNPGMAQKALYVQGQNDDQIVIRPAGLLSLVAPSVSLAVDGPEARKSSRKTIAQFGLGNSLVMIRDVALDARNHGDLLYFKYLGQREVNGRKTFAFERRIVDDLTRYPDTICIYHLDQEWLLPTAVTCLAADGSLLGRYLYSNLKFNVGLTDQQFARKANGL